MNKRIIAFITVFAMLFTLCGGISVFAEEETPAAADAAYNEAVKVISALGVNSFADYEKVVTYNMFYDALSTILSQGGAALDISDLTGISFSRASGSASLTYEDAVRSLVNLLGYKAQTDSANGGFALYASIASRIGLLADVENAGGNINARNAAIMLKNALDTDMLQVKTLGTKVSFETVKGETLLYVYRGIKNDEGVVEANGYTSFFSDDGAGKDRVIINGTVYEDEKGAACDFIGYAVKYYYYDTGKTDKILTAYLDDELNDVIEINGNFTGFEGRKVYYTNENGKEKNVTIPGNVPVIYNGAALSKYDSSVFDFTDCRAYLIDNDNDGKIEVVAVWKSTEYYVNSVDTILTKIHDDIGNRLIDLSESSDFDRIRFYDENGEKTTFYSIGAGDLLTAYISENGHLFDAYVSKTTVDGKVIEIGKDNTDRPFVTIGEKEYFMTDAFYAKEKENLLLGISGTFHLNRDGKIAYAVYTTGAMDYAYLTYIDYEDGTRGPISGRILKSDGKFAQLKLKEKVKIDGKNYTSTNDALKALKDAVKTSGTGVIRYDVDENGEVYVVDTAYRSAYEGENTLFSFGAKSSAYYTAATTLFPTKFRLDAAKTVLFFVPSDDKYQGEEHFGVGDPSMLKSSTSHIVQGFGTDKTNFIPEVVVCDESFILDLDIISSTPSFVFKEAKKVLNEDGDETYKITYFKTYAQKEAYCADTSVLDTSGIKSGDVFVGLFNNKGEFSKMLKVYDAKTHKMDLSYYDAKSITTTSYSQYCYQISGYVYFNNGTTIGVCTDDPSTITEMGDGKITWFKISDTIGTLVDSSYKESDARYMRRLAGIEIKDYVRYGSDCAQVYVRVDNNSTQLVAVYQK